MASSSVLFTPTKIGGFSLKNRIIMSPMTRNRGVVPSNLHQEYYVQRASAGLIITEGVYITKQAGEWVNVAGLYNNEQVEGWKKVVDGVHKAGGLIVAQLWHVGRLTHPLNNDGKEPIGPSPIAAEGGRIQTSEGLKTYVKPRALTQQEILEHIDLYEQAATNAKKAGFDGVEVHGAFGYLPNQFLHECSNQRTDEWGGSFENRSRFLFEILKRCKKVYGAPHVGLKLSPSNTYNSMKEANNVELYTTLVKQINKDLPDLAYLHLMEPSETDIKYGANPVLSKTLRPLWKGSLIANCGYEYKTAVEAVEKNEADAVSFGRLFLANPDLPERFIRGGPFNNVKYEFAYSGGSQGYTDYPFLDKQ